MTIYMILFKAPDYHDSAGNGDTIDRIDEDYGYFTDKAKAQVKCDYLQAEEDNSEKFLYDERNRRNKTNFEKAVKEQEVLAAAGLRDKNFIVPAYREPKPWTRSWDSYLYEVIEIEPAKDIT